MLTPSILATLAIFMPFVVAVLSHIISRILKFGSSIAKIACILTAYMSFFFISALIPIARNEPVKAHIFSIFLPIGKINVGFYIDCLSLIPAFLSSLFTALALTYNTHYLSPYNRAYKTGWEFNRSYSFILLLNGAMLGTLFSDNLLGLLIFWELVSLCSYVLISFWNEDHFSLFAAMKALIMTHIGGLALLIAVIIMYSITGTLEISTIGQKIPVNDPITHIILSLLLISTLPKTVLFPFHTWLPDGTVAPTSATIVFHVCGFQSGIYMIIRFFLDVFHDHTTSTSIMILHPIFGNLSVWGFILSLIGSLTIIIGVLNGLIENNFKRIVAYGTISGLGYIVMAIGLATPLGIAAALFLMIAHAFTFGLLFLCAGAVAYSTGKHDINDVEGLYQRMPITTLCCLMGVLSMSTVPLFIDFAGKYLIFNAIISAESIFFIVVAFLGCILNAAAAIRLFHSAFMRKTFKVSTGLMIRDPSFIMILPMILMGTAVVFFGVTPIVLLDLFITSAIKQILHDQSINTILQLGFIETPLGFWNPVVTAISMILLFSLFIGLMLYSRKTILAYRASISEEAVKPFICGEDLGDLDGLQAHHFYYTLTNVLEINSVCHMLNVDRLYNLLSTRFFDLTRKMIRLDIKQNYFPAVLSFVFGALITIIIAVLVR